MDKYSLIQNIWIILIIWGFLYFGDYYFTIYSARKFKDQFAKHYRFERSFELNPIFEQDVNNLRLISPRFIMLWLITSLVFLLLWWVSKVINFPQLFHFILGELMLLEIAIHLRHYRNIAIIKSYKEGAIIGHIQYSYWFGLKLSAWELFAFSMFYFFISLIVGSWFFAGGAVGCLIVSANHHVRSKKEFNSQEIPQSNPL